jgi:phage baseplate assembly protein V
MDFDDGFSRSHYRMRNTVGRITLHLIDDRGPVQVHQGENYTGEVRNGMQRVGSFGFSAVPLPGAAGVALYQGGHRGFHSIIGVEDPRYRLRGLNGGEAALYMVDGAASDGSGGTMRRIVQGLLGWAVSLFGATIAIGDGNTQTVTITAGQGLTIAGDVTITGNLTVLGKTTTVQNITIAGTESGGGPT